MQTPYTRNVYKVYSLKADANKGRRRILEASIDDTIETG
jgi:hypothetical protein